jgi:chromosome segregation ATPase
MRPVWQKLFSTGPEPAPIGQRPVVSHGSESGAASAARSGLLGPTSSEGAALNSEKVARTFDAIGRRNETLRAQLAAIEFSFRNIEAIRAQFHDALPSIDQTLTEIERTKVAHLDAERKLESLAAAHDGLEKDRAELRVERDQLAVAQNGLLARVAALERAIAEAEAASAEAHAALAERSEKLEQTDRELEDMRRGLHAANEQLPAIRAEFAAKENRIKEVDRQRAALSDHCNLLTEENAALRARSEEFVVNASKLNRELTELKSERDELRRLLEEVETALGQETAAHAKLKAVHFDAIEAQRLNEANLQEKLAATSTRLEAAQRLLAEARAEMQEQDAAIRASEQRHLDQSMAAKSLEIKVDQLEKDLASARAGQMEAEAARAAAAERSETLAKSMKDQEASLESANEKIAMLEARIEEQKKSTIDERAAFEERVAKLTKQFEAEAAARSFAEGALHTARQERSARLKGGGDGSSPSEEPSAIVESAPSKIAWLRR